MACNRRIKPIKKKVVIVNSDDAFHLSDDEWNFSTGVDAIDFLFDVRNRVLGSGAAVSLKPALQYAQVRPDRPGSASVITAGSAVTAEGLTHYRETLSAGSQFWWRPGFMAKLTAGAFAEVEVCLEGSYRSCAQHFPTREIEITPFNDLAGSVRYIPLTGLLDTSGVNIAKCAIVILDNANNKLQFRIAGRAFNDRLARGGWTDLESGWSTPTAGDSVANTGEISLSGLSLSSYQYMELAVACRKDADGSANSRCILHVTPAVTYG